MQAAYPAFRERGVEVVAVCQAKPEYLAMHLNAEPLPFPLVTDPERIAYRAFGLERGSWWMFFTWRALHSYLGLMFSGWRVRWPKTHEDLLQLGGDFLLDSQRRVTFSHRSADPGDRPTIETLLAAFGEGPAPMGSRGN